MGNEVTALNSHIPRHLQAAVTCTQVCANVLYCEPRAREEQAKQAGRKQDKRDAIKMQLVCLPVRSSINPGAPALVTFLRLKLPLGLALLPGMWREIGGGGEKAGF